MENLGIVIFFIIFSLVKRLLQPKNEAPVPGKVRRPIPSDREQEGYPVQMREPKKSGGLFDEIEELLESISGSGSGQRPKEKSYPVSDTGSVIRDRKREKPVLEQRQLKLEKMKEERARAVLDKKEKIVSYAASADPISLEVGPEGSSLSGFRVTKDNLAAGIVFSEVLGPPRSRKPFSLRQSNIVQNSNS
ncbi:hypothetical protein [Candidatus Contubernalis alkaliaceticus]|uniref:hypothetical protein n=1 Tax=Candidatus Contubernalis alkaliaceticus TaxID=338645 RepID=UPI001F4BDFDC|nr:hypothetical protein [Candidatus Contubernalis alkalaceticus]UNC93132.1 hypothetical protein HUE98_14165 [Candidatus Contubernalis alkalaceticus]